MTNSAELLPPKAWPFYGYAPGAYFIKCMDCHEERCDCDKRAVRCLECAVIASKEEVRNAGLIATSQGIGVAAESRPSQEGDVVARAIAEHFAKSFGAHIEDDGYGVIVNLPPIASFRFNASNVARAALDALSEQEEG